MPNHVHNRLTINGTDEQVRSVREYICSKKNNNEEPMYIDFNNIIKMPNSLNVEYDPDVDLTRQLLYEKSFYYEELSRINSWKEFAQHDKAYQTSLIESAIQIQKNIECTGHAFRRSWINEYWGTGGNAYSQKLEGENVITFLTDSGSSCKVISALASRFPKVKFNYKYTVKKEYDDSLPF